MSKIIKYVVQHCDPINRIDWESAPFYDIDEAFQYLEWIVDITGTDCFFVEEIHQYYAPSR